MDLMSDELFDGRWLRIVTIVDTLSRVSPLIGVAFRGTGYDVARAHEEAARRCGMPERIRLDNGPEFVSTEVDLWAYATHVVLDFSRPGKPTGNACIESFNSRCRQECLNQHWFLDLEDACAKIECWRLDYNRERPHSSLGNRPPEVFLAAFCSGQGDQCAMGIGA